jgi:excisionase family DNA binding protein
VQVRKDKAMNEILTLDEMKKYLRVHEMTLYRWVKNGIVPGFKVGGRWRFKKSEVDAWIDRNLKP